MILPTRKTRRCGVWDLLSDGDWHATMEVNDVSVGGSEGCRRLRELRAECIEGKRGFWRDIECKKSATGSDQWLYRLVTGPAKPDRQLSLSLGEVGNG